MSCELSASITTQINTCFYQYLLLKPVSKNSVYFAPYWPPNAPFNFLLCKNIMNLIYSYDSLFKECISGGK